RHAIGASEIAAVHDRDAQVVQGPAKAVRHADGPCLQFRNVVARCAHDIAIVAERCGLYFAANRQRVTATASHPLRGAREPPERLRSRPDTKPRCRTFSIPTPCRAWRPS